MKLQNGLPIIQVTLYSDDGKYEKAVSAVLSTGNVVSRFRQCVLQQLQYENIVEIFPSQIRISITGTDKSKFDKIIDVISHPDEDEYGWNYECDVVIGLDILKNSFFMINGQTQDFSLQFE